MILKKILRKHRLLISSIIFNLFKLIGYFKFPSYHPYFRSAMNNARAGYWSIRVRKMGKGVQIDSKVLIRGDPLNLEIGDYSYIDTNVHLEIYKKIKIGNYVHLANGVYIQSGSEVIIGDFACVANGTKIYASSNTYKAPDNRENLFLLSMSSSAPATLQYIEHSPVTIDEYAFIGLNCVILPGIKIGKGAIIGAGSVVTRDVPPYMIAVGSPARIVKKRPVPDHLLKIEE